MPPEESPAGGASAERMREDWNRRAREDAHYYVAFGRRQQSAEEFFATAREQVLGLEAELRRLPPGSPRARRALEIGCGPGRLMLPMSRHFGEIHGVDISDEMIEMARRNLASVPHAHPRHAPNSDLEAFADSSIDFVYSYAVFQHIPDREVVVGYLREACRVLKPGGVIRCQINGLPKTARVYDTWSGVRVSADEVRELARELRLMLLALEGTETQYMWVTLAKPVSNPAEPATPAQGTIRRVTNANSSEPVAPVRGRFASISLWVDGLPGAADLNSLTVLAGGKPGTVTFLGQPARDGLRQLNALLPDGLGSGLQPVELLHGAAVFSPPARIRLIPPGPPVPRLMTLSDGIDLMSGTRLVTRTLKLTVEEVANPGELKIAVAGAPAEEREWFCINPRVPTHEINAKVPLSVGPGPAMVEVHSGRRRIAVVPVEVG